MDHEAPPTLQPHHVDASAPGSGTESLSSGGSLTFLNAEDEALVMGDDSLDDTDAQIDAPAGDSKPLTWFKDCLDVALKPGSPATNELKSEIKHVLDRKNELKVEKRTLFGMMAKHEQKVNDQFAAVAKIFQDLQEKNASQDADIQSQAAAIQDLQEENASQAATIQSQATTIQSQAVAIQELKEENASQEASINELREENASQAATIQELKDGPRTAIDSNKYETYLMKGYLNKENANRHGAR